MKESYNKGLADHIDPESCVDIPRGCSEALTGGNTGGLLSSENTVFQRSSQWLMHEDNTADNVMRVICRSGGIVEPSMCGHLLDGNRDTSNGELKRGQTMNPRIPNNSTNSKPETAVNIQPLKPNSKCNGCGAKFYLLSEIIAATLSRCTSGPIPPVTL